MKLNTAMMLLAMATAGQATAKPLVIATDATYPPFEMVDSNGQLGGDGMAIAGLVLGWISAALWIVGIVIIFTVLGGLAWFAKMNS